MENSFCWRGWGRVVAAGQKDDSMNVRIRQHRGGERGVRVCERESARERQTYRRGERERDTGIATTPPPQREQQQQQQQSWRIRGVEQTHRHLNQTSEPSHSHPSPPSSTAGERGSGGRAMWERRETIQVDKLGNLSVQCARYSYSKLTAQSTLPDGGFSCLGAPSTPGTM